MADLRILLTLSDSASAGLAAVQGALRGLGQEAGIAGIALTGALTAPLANLAQLGVSFADMQQRAQIAFTQMTGSAEQAKAFLADLSNFAATTPFELKSLIPQAQRLVAMGIEAKNVIPILHSVGDAVGALGGGSALIDRVTLAIGQMSAKGKVSGEEMRQLAEAGIPAWQFLADKIGVSVPEAMKKVEQGAVSATVGITALIEGMDAKFGGGMEQASKLASGALSNLKDVADQTLGSLLSPALQSFADLLNTALPYIQAFGQQIAALDAPTKTFIVGIAAAVAAVGPLLVAFGAAAYAISFLLGPIGLAVAALAGLTLAAGVAAAAFVSNWNGVADRFGPVLQQIASKLGDLAGQALDWGANVIVAFANGMASAVDAIVQVLNFIADIVAFWMAPGSPPKFLPDLEIWGAGAMSAYMAGWKNGDFTVFNDLAGLVEQELRNAFRTSNGGFNLFDAIMGSREGIAHALDDIRQYGEIGADAMNRIRESAGPVADAVEAQVRLYGELERATRDVENAQRDLNRLQREKDVATKPLERELQQIRNQKDAIADQQELARLEEQRKKGKLTPDEAAKVDLDIRERQIRQQIRAIEDQKQTEIDAAKDRLDAAKEAETGVKDQIDAQKAAAQELQKNIALWDEFHQAASGGGAAGGGAAGLVNKLKLDLPDVSGKVGELKTKWDELTSENGPFGKLMQVWDRLEKGLPDPFEKMRDSVADLVKHIQEAFALQDSRAPAGPQTGATAGEQNFNVGQTASLGGAVGNATSALGGFISALTEVAGKIIRDQLGAAAKAASDALNAFDKFLREVFHKQAVDSGNAFEAVGNWFRDDLPTTLNDWALKLKNQTDSLKAISDALDDQKDPAKQSELALRNAARALNEMAARADAWTPVSAQTNGGVPVSRTGPGGEDGPFIAGARAGGGPVFAGRLYRVNEYGTEYFRPAVNGAVIPLGGSGGSSEADMALLNAQSQELAARFAQLGAMAIALMDRLAALGNAVPSRPALTSGVIDEFANALAGLGPLAAAR